MQVILVKNLLTNIVFTRMKMQLCHSFHLPTTRSHFKVDQSSHVQFIDKYILMISNMSLQDVQRAVSVRKNEPMTQAAGSQARGTCLYEADQFVTMAGAIMRRMLLVGGDLSYLFLFLVVDNNVIILYVFLDLSVTSAEVQQQTHDLETLLVENLLWTTSNAR